ncbi:MAG: AAA family ATPase [Gammaproteobacteria bacterium]|nr:AAA family ATPase [Gammaproteobacteria bacterium]
MYPFLNPLKLEDFNQKTEFLIDGFIPKHLITMIYADGGMGKSWLAMAIAKFAEINGMNAIYLDYDNPMNVLKERGIETKLIQVCPNLHYSHRSKTELQPLAMLQAIEDNASGNNYNNTLFVIDSLRDFGDVNNDGASMRLGEKLKNIREAGATIIVLHHSNKDGRNYQGSNNIRNSIDNMYLLTKTESPTGEIHFILTVKKERANIIDIAFKVKIDDLSLLTIDLQDARLNTEEKSFINEVKAALGKGLNLNKTDLLNTCGYEKTDKTARDRLDQYQDIYWACSKVKGIYTYSLIQ